MYEIKARSNIITLGKRFKLTEISLTDKQIGTIMLLWGSQMTWNGGYSHQYIKVTSFL